MNFSRSPYPRSTTHPQPTGSRRAALLTIDLQMNQLNTSPLLHHRQHRCSYPRGTDRYGNGPQEMYRIPFGATASICVSTSEPRGLPGDAAHQEWFRPRCTVITILMNTFGLEGLSWPHSRRQRKEPLKHRNAGQDCRTCASAQANNCL